MTQQQPLTTYPIAQLERRFTAFAVDRLLAWSVVAVVGVATVLLVSDDLWTVVGAVAATTGDLIAFVDSDLIDPDPQFVPKLLGPLLASDGIHLVKCYYRRPLAGSAEAHGGGRVTELVARPLLNLHFPSLAGFTQPLAGEIAIRRDLFEQLSVPVGYGVEIAMLIDALALAGLAGLAEVDLGARQNRHQSLRALSAMAGEVMVAVEKRIGAAPRHLGRRLAWTLRHPSRGASRIACGRIRP